MAQQMTTTVNRELTPSSAGEATRPAAVSMPPADIYETQDHVVLVADMPGVAPGDVDVSLERRVLTIRGHVPVETHEGYRRVHTEFGERDFQRVFALSEEIDRDLIEASHKNGVLTLKLPKAELARTRKIEVKSG